MQSIGFITVGNTRIRVLYRATQYGKSLKKADGNIQPSDKHLTDESDFLSMSENWIYVQNLLDGKEITL